MEVGHSNRMIRCRELNSTFNSKKYILIYEILCRLLSGSSINISQHAFYNYLPESPGSLSCVII